MCSKGILTGVIICLLLLHGASYAALAGDEVLPNQNNSTASDTDDKATVVTPAVTDEDRLRLELARSRLFIETGRVTQAVHKLDALEAQYPGHAEIPALRAEGYMRVSQNRRALELLDRAAHLAPGNVYITRRERDVASRVSPYVEAGHTVLFNGEATREYRTHIGGEAHVGGDMILGIRQEQNHLRARQTQRADGRIGAVNADRYRGELYLHYDPREDYRTGVSLYGGNGVAGVGGFYSWLDLKGETRADIRLQEPNWDFTQSIIDEGSRNSISLSRRHLWTGRLTSDLSAGLHQYNLDGVSGAAESFGMTASLGYTLPKHYSADWFGSESYISVNYYLDAEYPFAVESRLDASGVRYEPLPLNASEIHTLNLTLSKTFTDYLSAEVFGGFSIDRLGGTGPSYGASVTYTPLTSLVFDARALRTISTENTDDTLDQLGVNARWIF